jgi:hypothetical protein
MRSPLLMAILLAPALFAQDSRLGPDHIATVSLGQSLDEFLSHRPNCAPLTAEASGARPGQNLTHVMCWPDPLPAGAPDLDYGGVALRTINAVFLSKDGLVSLTFRFSRKDFRQVKSQLITEFGIPRVSIDGHLEWGQDSVIVLDRFVGKPPEFEAISFLSLQNLEQFVASDRKKKLESPPSNPAR